MNGYPKMKWEELQPILDRALDLAPDESRAFLEEKLGVETAALIWDQLSTGLEDVAPSGAGTTFPPSVRGDLGALAERVIERFGRESLEAPTASAEDEVPRRAGHYRLGAQLGAGGMGVVFEGHRDDGEVERVVAVKVVRADRGLHWAERFRQERDVLARLAHPGITTLFDAGVLEDGRPYFVMEKVDGERIDDYCDRKELGLRARCGLFLQILEVLEHAHSRLVVHRDLKPSNVLVNREGRVRLLDFGIAKLLEGAEEPGLTQTRMRVFTPEYAAPEQVRGEDLSTATDVFGAGLLAYELLTSVRAHRGSSSQELENQVVAGSITRPSTVVAELAEVDRSREARARSTTSGRWEADLLGDLDAILLKALRAEPEARYASAGAFKSDLRNYLVGLPVEARRGGWRYSASRFVLRNRALVAATSLGTVALILGIGLALWQATVAREDRDRALVAEAGASSVNRFLTDILLAPDITRQGPDVRLLDIMNSARAVANESLDDTPQIQGRILFLIGRVKASLGDRDDALEVLAEAEAALEKESSESPLRESIQVRIRRAEILLEQPDLVEAEAVLAGARSALSAFERDAELWASWARLEGRLQHLRGNLEAAESVFREAMGRLEPAGESDQLAILYSDLAVTLEQQGRLDEAAAAYGHALQWNHNTHGDRHETSLVVRQNLAGLLAQTGRLEEAEAMLRTNADVALEWLGEQHPLHVVSFNSLLSVLADQGKVERALEFSEEALRLSEAAWGVGHPRVLILQMNIGSRLLIVGRHQEAEEILRSASDGLAANLGPGAPPALHAQMLLCEVLLETGRPAQAAAQAERALALASDGLAPWITLSLRARRGSALGDLGDFEDAEKELRASFEGFRDLAGPTSGETLGAQLALGEILLKQGEMDDARKILCDAQRIAADALGEGHTTRQSLKSAAVELGGCR